MSPAEKQARDDMAERKMQKAIDKAYMGALTTTEPNPAPSKEPRDAVRGQKGYAKGGSASARADGCCTKGKTKGRMV